MKLSTNWLRISLLPALTLFAGCTTADAVGSSAEKLISVPAAPTLVEGLSSADDFDVSAVWSTSPASGVTTFAAGLDRENGTPGGTQRFSWAFSNNSAGPFTYCSDGAPGCGTVPKTALTSWKNWSASGPALATDGLTQVVYVVPYNTVTGATVANQIAAVGSNDGGRTYTTSISLTKGAGEGCNSGTMRLPNVTFDPTTGVFWAVWGHQGSGSFGGCIRSFTMSGGTISFGTTPASSGRTIDNMDREGVNDGQGALLVQANDGLVTVAYSNQDNVPATCPTTNSIGWGAVTTFNGADWTSNSVIKHTTTFNWCAISNKVIKGHREFDFVVAPDGTSYAAVNDTANTIRLFMSSTRGVKITGANATNDSPWREFCPGQGVAGGNWTIPGGTCSAAVISTSGIDVFRPTLSADGNSRLSLMFYQQDVSGGSNVAPQYIGNILPRMASGSFQGPQALTGAFDPNPGSFWPKLFALGEYMALPADRTPTSSCSGETQVQAYFSQPSGTVARQIFTEFVGIN